jgi:hypothetical protein
MQSEAKVRELEKQIADAQAEEVRIHRLVEFRRSKRTGDKWMAFCPKCHLPVGDNQGAGGSLSAFCTANCGWHVYPAMTVGQMIKELES